MKKEINLSRCPFCNGFVIIKVTDEEGNIRNDDYERNPWSGLGCVLSHEIKFNSDCPIATWNDEILGTCIYDTRVEAAMAWNRRFKND